MKELLFEIKEIQNEIVTLMDEIIIANKQFMIYENWFCSNPSINIQNQDDDIVFINASDKANYISLIEKNTYFNSLPKIAIEVLPKEVISCEMNVEIVGKSSVHVAIIEYSHLKKVTSTLYSCKQKFKHVISDQTHFIRIALKISGKGIVTLKAGAIKRNSEPIVEKIEKPSSKTSTIKRNITNLKHLNVAGIMDEFTATCYQEEVNLLTFTPLDFKEILSENRPDFLFVESAWKGNKGAWEFKIGKYAGQNKSEIFSLLEWCQERKIPTVFWNKEDPIHFDKFIETAERFDYIYTTDANMIEKYKERCGHNNVYALPFSAQPKFHNPIELPEGRKDKVSFAGSYYANRHQERKDDMENILEVANFRGLDIYDRNFERSKGKRTDFSFPKRFEKNVKGSLPYQKIQKAYKGYDYMVNVNSIKYSPTMFSRRVFEGLASGTLIISSYSEGIKKIFGNIVMIEDKNETLKEKFENVLQDKKLFKQKKLKGIREVFLNHTYAIRLEFMLNNMGYTTDIKKDVTIIAEANTIEEVNKIITIFNRQMYLEKKLLILTDIVPENVALLELNKRDEIKIVIKNQLKNYTCMNSLVNSEYFIYLNLDNFYGKHFIEDLICGAIYSNADIITKNNYFEYRNNKIVEISHGAEYRYANQGHFSNALIKTDIKIMDDIPVLLNKIKHDASLKNYFLNGRTIFSIDNANFVKNGGILSNKLKEKIEL